MLACDFQSRPTTYPAPVSDRYRSPLGVRDGNIHAWPATSTAPSIAGPQKLFSYMSQSSSSSPFGFSFDKPTDSRRSESQQTPQYRRRLAAEPRKRESKYAALMRRNDDRDLRRQAYLSNSRRAGDDKIFEARMEQSWRRDWFDEEREWRARMEAQYDEQPLVNEEEDFEIWEERFQYSEDSMQDDSMLEEPPSDDEDGYQQFLWSQEQTSQEPCLPDFSRQQSQHENTPTVREFWSDDDDFEDSLLEAVMQAEQHTGTEDTTTSLEPMDTDMMT